MECSGIELWSPFLPSTEIVINCKCIEVLLLQIVYNILHIKDKEIFCTFGSEDGNMESLRSLVLLLSCINILEFLK